MAQRSVDDKIRQLGSFHRGAVSLAQLRMAGLTDAEVRSRRGALLAPVAPGVFIVGLATPEALTSAALLSVGQSVVSHGSAASFMVFGRQYRQRSPFRASVEHAPI